AARGGAGSRYGPRAQYRQVPGGSPSWPDRLAKRDRARRDLLVQASGRVTPRRSSPHRTATEAQSPPGRKGPRRNPMKSKAQAVSMAALYVATYLSVLSTLVYLFVARP